MTKEEAQQQIETFFRQMGEKGLFFKEENLIKTRIGQAVIGFEYDEEQEILSALALIYRFRNVPPDRFLDAVFAEETDTNCGGGRVVFNSVDFSFYLQRDFREKVGENFFYMGINKLALASVRWNKDILTRIAVKPVKLSYPLMSQIV